MKTESQKARSKMMREEKKKIESQLHPNPIFNGSEVAHEHRRDGYIYFTAWKGNNQINRDLQLRFKRSEILRYDVPGEFYKLYTKDFKWLTERGK